MRIMMVYLSHNVIRESTTFVDECHGRFRAIFASVELKVSVPLPFRMK